MAGSIRVTAAAKVNLHLRVYPRRSDGFHGILSLFQAVSLADELVIRSLKESDTIEIKGDFDCPAEFTTVYKAASAYLCASGLKRGLSISVDKRIPAGAGLGGGSSDAAATLLGLEACLGGGLDQSRLSSIGASIGSDVPFFLNAAAAIVSGRGEVVEAIEARADFRLLLVDPGFPVSTVSAYGLLDMNRRRDDEARELDPTPGELIAAYRGRIRDWPFANSFEPIIGEQRREIANIRRLLLDSGASFAAMSGSGSTLFGVFEEGSRPCDAADRLRAVGYKTYIVSPLARMPCLD
jgi:4-diphosphocytidyl-2-C-methyl-D-erythritol kinase